MSVAQHPRSIAILGAPMEAGASQRGCLMGPAALRTAGLAEALTGLGFAVEDLGDIERRDIAERAAGLPAAAPEGRARNYGEVAAWSRTLAERAYAMATADRLPVFLGGDHCISMGSVAGLARRAEERGRPLHVLWLDAHPDFHTLETSESGNMHGMAVAAFCGLPGLDGLYEPGQRGRVSASDVRMIGVRSVDLEEGALLARHGVHVDDMRAMDEFGAARLVRHVIEQARAEDAILHVSLDVDFLDPEIAPGVGTTVPGGATFREAHLIMELLHESGLVGSLDIVELNPFLDERGRTARLMVDLAASLFGRKVIDRPTRTSWSAA